MASANRRPLLHRQVTQRRSHPPSRSTASSTRTSGPHSIVTPARRWCSKAVESTLITLSDGGAAIHIADGFTSRALVLVFADARQVSGISEGAQFRFRCTVQGFDYLYVQLKDCSIVR